MAITSTFSLPRGTSAPDFQLPDVVNGNRVSLTEYTSSKALLISFVCRHCPYVVHVRSELIQMANDYLPKGVAFVAISSNDAVRYPDDAPAKLREMAIETLLPFPLLYDESQDVARAYTAACTPDFFLFDDQQKLAYRGRMDDSTPGNGRPVTGKDLRAALDAILTGTAPNPEPLPSMGCGIKWR